MKYASALLILAATICLTTVTPYEYTFPIVVPPYNRIVLTGKDTPVKPPDLVKTPDVSTCLLYIEGLAVTVFKKEKGKGEKDHTIGSAAAATISGIRYLPKDDAGYKDTTKLPTFTYNDGDAQCYMLQDIKPPKQSTGKPKGIKDNFSFNVNVNVKEPVNAYSSKEKREAKQPDFVVGASSISFTLTFSRDKADWYTWGLSGVTGHSLEVKKGQTDFLTKDLSLQNTSMPAIASSVGYMKVYGFGNYSYGCNCTKAALFPSNDADKNYQIGLSFVGIQVLPYGAVWRNKTEWVATFTPYVNDCVGTFSTGSVMGIIVAIILSSVLIFAFLMLNSVETVDRFDDPRQKPLVINFKE